MTTTNNHPEGVGPDQADGLLGLRDSALLNY